MPYDDEEFEVIDKNSLITWLLQAQLGAQAHAFGAKDHVAIKAYAQAAAFQFVADQLVAGTFDAVPIDGVIN